MKYLLLFLVFVALVSISFSDDYICQGERNFQLYRAMVNMTQCGNILYQKTDTCLDEVDVKNTYLKFKCSQDGYSIQSEKFSCKFGQICKNTYIGPQCEDQPQILCGDGTTVCTFPSECGYNSGDENSTPFYYCTYVSSDSSY